jgi:peptidoglycan/LPS O-acetylase OafA/YrhL
MARERYVLLDGLRGLAACAIAVHHFTEDTGHGELFASASIAVDFFFCLSGFVIAYAYHERLLGGMKLREYALKRVSRLYPMYLTGLLIGTAAVILLKERGFTSLTYDLVAKAFLLNLFYVPFPNWEYLDIFQARLRGAIFPLNSPAWSLFFGMVANVLYAASLRVSQRAPLILATVAAVGLAIAAALYGEAPGWGARNFIGGFPRVLYAFFAGVVIYQFHDRTARLPQVPAWALAAVIVVVVAMPRFPLHREYWLIGCLLMAPLAVAIGSRCSVEPGTRAHRICQYSGRISYPIFCVHYPLLMLFSLLPHHTGKLTLLSLEFAYFVAMAVAFFFTTLVVAHVLMTRVEEPLRKWMESLRTRPASPGPAD